MAHEITATDQIFTVHQPAWHGLGHVLEGYPTREEAQKLVHPWEPVDEEIYRKVPHITAEGELRETFQPIEGEVARVRSDTHEHLGVVPATLGLVTNHEMWDVAEALQGSGVDVKYETGGSLKGGRKVWLLLRLNEPIGVPGDPNGQTLPYYALQNSHDGSGSFRGQGINTRIVCANTSRAADLSAKARGTEFVFRHTRNVRDRIEEAKRALAAWRSSIEDYQAITTHLMDLHTTADDRTEFLHRLLPEPPDPLASDVVRRNVATAREQWLDVLHGSTNEGITDTAWGLVAATIEWDQHVRYARNAETRFTRTVLNQNRVVSDAVKLAEAVAR